MLLLLFSGGVEVPVGVTPKRGRYGRRIPEEPDPVPAVIPPKRSKVPELAALADAAEARVSRLEAAIAPAKQERAVARLKTDHAASLAALEEARLAEWNARLRDDDDFMLLAA